MSRIGLGWQQARSLAGRLKSKTTSTSPAPPRSKLMFDFSLPFSVSPFVDIEHYICRNINSKTLSSDLILPPGSICIWPKCVGCNHHSHYRQRFKVHGGEFDRRLDPSELLFFRIDATFSPHI